MHSTQFTAIARYLDNEGLEVKALSHLPGAMQDADGVWVLAYSEQRDQGGNPANPPRAFCLISLHVGLPGRTQYDLDRSVNDIMCGDRIWMTLRKGFAQFAIMVDEDMSA